MNVRPWTLLACAAVLTGAVAVLVARLADEPARPPVSVIDLRPTAGDNATPRRAAPAEGSAARRSGFAPRGSDDDDPFDDERDEAHEDQADAPNDADDDPPGEED